MNAEILFIDFSSVVYEDCSGHLKINYKCKGTSSHHRLSRPGKKQLAQVRSEARGNDQMNYPLTTCLGSTAHRGRDLFE